MYGEEDYWYNPPLSTKGPRVEEAIYDSWVPQESQKIHDLDTIQTNLALKRLPPELLDVILTQYDPEVRSLDASERSAVGMFGDSILKRDMTAPGKQGIQWGDPGHSPDRFSSDPQAMFASRRLSEDELDRLPRAMQRPTPPLEQSYYRMPQGSEMAHKGVVEPDPITALDLPIGPQEMLSLGKGMVGAAGLVELTAAGKEALKRGTPYKKIIDLLEGMKGKYFVPEVPETTYNPLVAIGATPSASIPDIQTRRKMPGQSVLGYYMYPEGISYLNLQKDAGSAGDFLTARYGYPNTIRHEHMHHFLEAMTGGREPSKMAGGGFGPRTDPTRAQLQKDLLGEYFAGADVSDVEPMAKEVRDSVSQVFNRITDPKIRKNAEKAIDRIYFGKSPELKAEEALTRSTGDIDPWLMALGKTVSQGKSTAEDILGAITSQPDVAKLLKISNNRIPESMFGNQPSMNFPPFAPRPTRPGLPPQDQHIDLLSLITGGEPQHQGAIARILNQVSGNDFSTNSQALVGQQLRSWRDKAKAGQPVQIPPDSPWFQAIIDYISRIKR